MMYTVKDVAERLNLSPTAVYQMVTDQTIPHHRVGSKGRSIRFTEQDIQTYLTGAQQEASTPSQAGSDFRRGWDHVAPDFRG